jgi:hypothetical protein
MRTLSSAFCCQSVHSAVGCSGDAAYASPQLRVWQLDNSKVWAVPGGEVRGGWCCLTFCSAALI